MIAVFGGGDGGGGCGQVAYAQIPGPSGFIASVTACARQVGCITVCPSSEDAP